MCVSGINFQFHTTNKKEKRKHSGRKKCGGGGVKVMAVLHTYNRILSIRSLGYPVNQNKMSRVVRKRIFEYAKTKTQISFAVTAKLISAFVFATRIVQSLYFLNPKFQVSSHLLWLYSPVCVGPGRKPRRPVFSQRGSNIDAYHCFK